jgi:uncharacterized protein YjeT (DUF2065 family)
MGHDLLVALSLFLVLEGILPFISPGLWRDAIIAVARMPDRQIRIMGLGSMLTGTLLLYLVNH